MKVHLVPKTNNKKTGKVAATYITGDTCPDRCPFLKICYANQGKMGNSPFKTAERYGTEDLTRTADGIRNLPQGTLVRHAVSGEPTAEYVAEIGQAHIDRPDTLGWTYLHSWPDRTPAEFPSNLVPNASCETPEELEKAAANGWDTVLVATGEDDELIGQKVAGKRVIVCPNQTRGVTCAECRLCMKRDRAVTIAFLPHGAKNMIGLAVASKR
jgi:hypothetical protein